MNKRAIIIGIGVIILILVVANFPKRKKQPVQAKATHSITAKELYKHGLDMKNDGRLLEAKAVYRKILSEFPDIDNVQQIQRELEEINMKVIFSNTQTPKTVIHEVGPGDTLGKLAKKYGSTIDLIKNNNSLRSDVIRLGQKLRIWTGKFNIYVDKSQNLLILKDGNEVIKVYNVSTGENNSTPTGAFKIVNRLVDPVWFNRGAIVPPESPANVLGSRWLGFDQPGYGIHGTIEPDTIGQQVTAGCVRMHNGDVEELYNIITVGTEVFIVD